MAGQMERKQHAATMTAGRAAVPRRQRVRWRIRLAVVIAVALCLILPAWQVAPHPAPLRAALTVSPAPAPRLFPQLLDGWSGEGPAPVLALRKARREGSVFAGNDGCGRRDLMSLTVCWLHRGDPESLDDARSALRAFRIGDPIDSGNGGNAWQLALAFDLLAPAALSEIERNDARQRLQQRLQHYLDRLDTERLSLWHGRSALASQSFIIAVVIADADPARLALLQRAQQHFLRTVEAIELTGAWPEGYSYWVQNRGLLFALAGQAWQYGLKPGPASKRVQDALCRHAWWPVYAARPDWRAETLGDETSRSDLREETQPILEAFAQLCDDDRLAQFAHALEQHHRGAAWYGDFRWQVPLLMDAQRRVRGGQWTRADAAAGLPQAQVFGRGAMNLWYRHTDWRDSETFFSFHAGHFFSHHGHYDAGHFTLFKGGPLIVNSSTYGSVFSPHRLHYAIRTVAKNSVLVLRPGERVRPNRFYNGENVADGGQRVLLPTGSYINSVEHWRAHLDAGLQLQRARPRGDSHRDGAYTWIAGDLTDAYNSTRFDANGQGGKVRRVWRDLIYIEPEDRLYVIDDIIKTDARYTAKSLFHTISMPELPVRQLLRGQPDDGVVAGDGDTARVQSGSGRLVLQKLLPVDGEWRRIGGPAHRYYVETDGDDSDLDGQSFDEGAKAEKWFDAAGWRLELQAAAPAQHVQHVVALSPSLERWREDRVSLLWRDDDSIGLDGGHCVLVYVRRQLEAKQFPARECLLIVGARRDLRVELTASGAGKPAVIQTIAADGTLWYQGDAVSALQVNRVQQ